MAGRLAAVPESSTALSCCFAPSCPRPPEPTNLYRDLIRSRWHIRPSIFSLPGQSGSSYCSSSGSGATSNCSSYPSNNSGVSSSSLSAAAAAGFGVQELTKVARQMASDGYTKRMVLEFEYGDDPDRILKDWFCDLEVDWVLQTRNEHGLQLQRQRQLDGSKSASRLQGLAQRWVPALTVIFVSVTELVIGVQKTLPTARFAKASISAMLVFVDTVVSVMDTEKLGPVLDMFVCVCSASHLFTPVVSSPEAQSIFYEIGASLEGARNRLNEAIFSTAEEVRTLMENDDSWAIGIQRGGGELHRNTRLMVNCIMAMVEVQALSRKYAGSYDNGRNIGHLIDDSVRYLKDLLLRKSELCSEPSLRYMFLLNNSNFIAQLFEVETRPGERNVLTPECEKYLQGYLAVSWGHVLPCLPETVFMDSSLDVSRGHLLSCIPKTFFHGPLQRWKKTFSLTKFGAAFHETYHVQKFWKVPEPWLRYLLRKLITELVISGYRSYLKERPELEKHVSGGSSSPEALEEKLGQLFEG